MDFKVIDNFLPVDKFNEIKNIVFHEEFPWYVSNSVAYENDNNKDYYFNHFMWNRASGSCSPFFEKVCSEILYNIEDIKSIMRIKVNHYPGNEVFREHVMHKDAPFDHKGAIFSFNTCNGYTKFKDGTKVDSVENRMIFFNPNELHCSTNTTDEKYRVNLIVNYL